MGLDPVTIGLGVITMALTVAQGAAAASAAEDQAQAQADLAANQMRELTRQQERTVEVSRESASDRVRAADQEFATVTASMAEAGALGTTNFQRIAQEVGFNEGLDLARISANTEGDLEALQSEKRAASEGVRSAARKAEAAGTRNQLSVVGSGLQIAGGLNQKRVEREVARGRTTS